MNKEAILAEIQRTAEENDGRPLSRTRFQKATGITVSDWYGKYWARWGDAVRDAGYVPNKLQTALPDEVILDALIDLIQDLGRFPSTGELRLRAHEEPCFPSHGTFRRIGRKPDLARRVIERCEERGGLERVVSLCASIARTRVQEPAEEVPEEPAEFGSVYLMKSGRYYKIGRSNAPGRREYELSIQLPDPISTVHVIRTDDPEGIESYWHRRFAHRHRNGEWFELRRADVTAFKRRRFM